MSIFDNVVDRNNTGSEKWEKYKGRDIIPMWVADADFETAPEIVAALQNRVAHGVFGYTRQPTTGTQDAIRFHLESQYDWAIDKHWIIPLPSLVSGLGLSCLLTEAEGDEILIPKTIYPPFKSVTGNAGRQAIKVPMRLDTSNGMERWVLDLVALEASITARTKLLLFCNPHNPGGTVYRKQELDLLQDICQQHGLLICSDEIHCDLVLDENRKHIPFATLGNDAANRSITLMAASKTFNIAGLGFGFAIVPDNRLRKRFKTLVQQRMPDINLLAQTATEAAFKHGENWRLQQIEYLRRNRDYLYVQINAIEGMKMYPLEATYLAWIDVSGLDLENPEAFFERAGVGIAAGKYYGDDRFIRLNFACRRALLEEAVKRIKRAVENRR